MKTLYLDLFSGISGDMFIGALIDLGVEAGQLEQELKKLRLDDYHLHVTRGRKASLEGVKFDVHLVNDPDHGDQPHAHTHPHQHSRTFAQIRQLITASQLSEWVKQKAVAVFQRIAVAEGKIHGLPPEQVHFHEVGAVDSIVDITGACIALEMLGKPRVMASPVVEGTGGIECATDVPFRGDARDSGRARDRRNASEPNELVTPTGAALLAELLNLARCKVVAEKIGYGLGTRTTRRAAAGRAGVSGSGPGGERRSRSA